MTLEIHTLTNVAIYERKKSLVKCASRRMCFCCYHFKSWNVWINEKVQCMACDLFEYDLQIMIDSLKLIFNETFSLRLRVSLFISCCTSFYYVSKLQTFLFSHRIAHICSMHLRSIILWWYKAKNRDENHHINRIESRCISLNSWKFSSARIIFFFVMKSLHAEKKEWTNSSNTKRSFKNDVHNKVEFPNP